MIKPQKLMAQAIAHYKQGKMLEATQLLDRILESNSSFVPALQMRGQMHLLGRQYHAAQRIFLKIAEIEPRNFPAHENLGKAYMHTGQIEHAERTFRHALKLKPGSVNSITGLGNACMALGKYEDALNILQSIKTAKRRSPIIDLNIGLANEKLGRREEAIRSFKRAIELAPDSPSGDLCLGKLFLRQKEYPEAELHLSRAINLGANDPETELCLAQAQFKQGKEDLASDHFFNVTERAPDFQGGYIELDNFLLFSGSDRKKRLIEDLSKDHIYPDWKEALEMASSLSSMYEYPDDSALETLQEFWNIYHPGELHDRAWWTEQLLRFGPPMKGHDKVLRGPHSAIFSWSLPDTETLSAIAGFTDGTRLRSYGAGSGLWERLLLDHFSIPVKATDCSPRHRFIEVGIEDFATAEVTATDTVFLAWIISGNTSVLNILENMQSKQKLVLIGEPLSMGQSRGLCASPAVFSYLEEQFKLEQTLPLVRFSHLNDTCTLYQKK